VTLWDIETGERHVGTEPSITGAAVSPDGSQVAAGRADGSVVLYDLSSAAVVRTMEIHEEPVLALAFHPEGRWVATSDQSGPIEIRDVTTGRLVYEFSEPIRLEGLTFSPDGRLLVAAQHPNSLTVWEAGSWSRHRLPDPIPLLLTVAGSAFSPAADRLATASTQQYLDVWSLGSGQLVWHEENLQNPRTLAISPDGRLLAAAEQHRVGLWELAGHKEPLVLSDSSGFTHLVFRGDGKLLLGGRLNGQVGTWNLREGNGPDWWFALHGMPDTQLRDVAFTSDGRHIVLVPGNGAAYVVRLAGWPLAPGG
jgi:WD40 repeat protein